MVLTDNIARFQTTLSENERPLKTTLRENETTLFDNRPITSALDQINANGHFSFGLGSLWSSVDADSQHAAFCEQEVFPSMRSVAIVGPADRPPDESLSFPQHKRQTICPDARRPA